MAIVKEIGKGQFERISGNPTLLSLDGTEKAPLAVIMHESWSAEDRARFGIFVAQPFSVPDGKIAVGDSTYERRDGVVVENVAVADAPVKVRPNAHQRLSIMLQKFDLTINELIEALAERKDDGVKDGDV